MQARVGMNTDMWVTASYIGPNGSSAMIIATCASVRSREREREQTKNGQDYPLLISNDLDKMSSDSCIPPRLVGTLSVIKGLNCLPFTVHMSVVATGPTLDMSSGHLVQLSKK